MRPHGYARYRLDGCRCYTCALARADYDDNRNRLIRLGYWQPFADVTETREHVLLLHDPCRGPLGRPVIPHTIRQVDARRLAHDLQEATTR